MPTKTQSKRAPAKKPAVPAQPSPPPKAGPVNEWFELRQSPIHGWGAFALKPIPKGTRLIEYAGERISNAEADRRYDEENMPEHHTLLFIISSRTVVDAAFNGNESRFINHSCDPNCSAEIINSRIWIEALRPIAAGEELAYDYEYDDDPAYTAKDYLFYACQCGSPECRGTIVDTKRKWRDLEP